eukprot:Rmarinus@m.26123
MAPLSEEELKRITGQYDLDTVFQVNLNDMDLSDISVLGGCSSLTEANLSNNQISDASFARGLKRLKRLVLTSNSISSLSFLQEDVHVEQLFLQGNRVADVTELDYIKSLPNLKTLYFQNIDGTLPNPVCEHPGYRVKILECAPNLINLDGERVKTVSYRNSVPDISKTQEKIEIPEVEPWLGGISLDPPMSEEEFCGNHDRQWQEAYLGAKKLDAKAKSAISQYN